MTVLEVIDNARALLQEPLSTARSFPDNTSSFWKDADMLAYFNMEQQAVSNKIMEASEHFFVTSTSVNLVANQQEYSLPSNNKKIVRVESFTDSSSPLEIIPISLNDSTNYTYGITAAGEPAAYTIKGQSMIFRPRPVQSRASGVKIYYVKRLQNYTSASSISEIPSEYHELLVWGIVKKCLFQQEGTGEALVAASTEYNRLMREMLKQIEDRQTQRPRRVKRRKRNFFRRY